MCWWSIVRAMEFCMAAFADESWRHIPISLLNCLGGGRSIDLRNLTGTSRAVHRWFFTRFDPDFGHGVDAQLDVGAAEVGRCIVPDP